jgi:hypothetical protein
MKTYQTREEIWADETLTVNKRADEIFALNARLAAMPPPPPPKPDTAERAQLQAIANSLTAASDEWGTLAENEKNYSETLAADVEKIRALECSTGPDSHRDVILDLIVARSRLELKRSFLENLEPRRREINQRILGGFSTLNGLLDKYKLPRHYLSGIDSRMSAQAGIATIKRLLE